MTNPEIELRIRLNRGNRLRPRWISAFRDITGVEVQPTDFLGLLETDARKQAFCDLLRSAPEQTRRYWKADQFPEIEVSLCSLADRVGNLPVILFNMDNECMGALPIRADLMLRHSGAVSALVGGDLCMVTSDLQSGFSLERNFYDANQAYVKAGVFELTTWGKFQC